MIDDQTLSDLSIFPRSGTRFSLFSKLDYCKTKGGKDELTRLMKLPAITLESVLERQEAIQYISQHQNRWNLTIQEADMTHLNSYLNIDRETASRNDAPTLWYYTARIWLFDKPQFYYTLSSVKLIFRLIQEINAIIQVPSTSAILEQFKSSARQIIDSIGLTQKQLDNFQQGTHNMADVIRMDKLLRVEKAGAIRQLQRIYYEFEALYSLAKAHQAMGLHFPAFTDTFQFTDLKHPLIPNAQGSTITWKDEKLIILTGANMSGKSTFIKSVGLACYMAYLGIGVRASHASIPVFDDVVSCMDIKDDIESGSSYFLAEVKRMKTIIDTINTSRRVLVLCDELFKGTNVEDSVECNVLVLQKMHMSSQVFTLYSTHFAGVAEQFRDAPNCTLAKFEADQQDGILTFNYQYQHGISYQRTGTDILKSHITALMQ